MAQPVPHYPPPWLSSPTVSSSLQQLLRLPLSSPLFEYVVDRLVDTVSAALDRSWDEGQQRSLRTPFLLPFVQSVLTKNRVSAATVLVALVYLDRSRKNLRVSAGFWACERALVGAMILANKYTNDDILSTKAWAISSTIFASRDVVKAEREFLQVLRYDLSVTEEQLMVHRLPLLLKVRDFAARHMVLKSAPHPHRAAAVRYCPYQTNQRPSATQAHVRRLVTRSATSSSSSLSPLDSPQLQTPPDPHPYSLAATGSELKRIYQPASVTLPYVLARPNYDTAVDAPMHAVDARHLTSLFRTSPPYSHTSRKDFGDRADKVPLPPLTGMLQQLDSNILPVPRSAAEVRPPRVSPEKPKHPQQLHGAYELGRFTLGADWYLHREQATATPPSFENTATVCAF